MVPNNSDIILSTAASISTTMTTPGESQAVNESNPNILVKLQACVDQLARIEHDLPNFHNVHVLLEKPVHSDNNGNVNKGKNIFETHVLYSRTVSFKDCAHQGPQLISNALGMFKLQKSEKDRNNSSDRGTGHSLLTESTNQGTTGPESHSNISRENEESMRQHQNNTTIIDPLRREPDADNSSPQYRTRN